MCELSIFVLTIRLRCLNWNAADLEEARQRISSLPLDVAELSEFEILPLVPYDGFARLFSDKSKG